MEKAQFIETVVSGIERTIFEGESGAPQNFVIFEFDTRYYTQAIAARGDFKIHCEAVGNGYMAEKDHISTKQIEQLIELGWSTALGESNHILEMPCESIEDRRKIGELFYQTAEIYNAPTIKKVEVHIP